MGKKNSLGFKSLVHPQLPVGGYFFQVEQLRNPSYGGKNKLNVKFSAPSANTVLGCTSLLLLYLSAGREECAVTQ